MSLYEDDGNPSESEPRLVTRRSADEVSVHDPVHVAAGVSAPRAAGPVPGKRSRPLRVVRAVSVLALVLVIIGVAGYFVARRWVRSTVTESLPQIDGTLVVEGLAAPVTVQRDGHGVPHIRAASLDDLLFAQGFVTAQDRLFQMDTIRRHAAGELAEILGASLIPHDKLQRTLQIRAAADRAVQRLPPDQLHLLETYARGVNASMQRQAKHLPIEFRVLRYKPVPWVPRDSLLCSLAMFEDLTSSYEVSLAREHLSAELTAAGAQDLIQDLYPVGSWRDHPPSTPEPDLTVPGAPIEQVPLDESQAGLQLPATRPDLSETRELRAGSNNWVVSGAHTASGKPLLANDMHLTHTLPGIWYEADLEAADLEAADGTKSFHAAGVSIPGLPLIVVGHNEHIAWGFTNLYAEVQDVYVEQTRGGGLATEFLSTDGSWRPVIHVKEKIKVKGGSDLDWDVPATRHGDAVTPLLTPVLKGETRPLALRWTIYDPAVVQMPVYDIDSARDWPSFLAAFAKFGGPGQNVVYADDQGHIGYHAVGRVPLRGPAADIAHLTAAPLPADVATPVPVSPANESPVIAANPDPLAATRIQAPAAPAAVQLSGALSPVPLVPSAAHEWSGYIPFDQLPQTFDPPGGVIATANSRVAANDYKYPLTLNWAAPYRNERVWHLLAHRTGMTPADMLAIQTDVYSDFDHVLAQRLAYAIDHSPQVNAAGYPEAAGKLLHEAADLLRNWNGRMSVDSSPAAIVASVHSGLWPALLKPHLPKAANLALLYQWYSKDYALEQILMHTPPRWLASGFTNWDDFLADIVLHSLQQEKLPSDLANWRYGSIHTVDVEHPIFDQSAALRKLLGRPTGTGPQPQSGDATTIKQVGHTFGPSERFTADLADLDHSTLDVVLGQSGNPASPWFMDQFPAWYRGTTFAFPFSRAAVDSATTHTLTLTPGR